MKSTILLMLLIFIAACTTGQSPDDHLGCQEGEIVNGECILSNDPNVGIFTEDISNVIGQNADLGYLARPNDDGNYPGIVVIHEWWGLNDNIKHMAKVLASYGYVVYAVDLYDGEVATTSERAGELAGNVRQNRDVATQKMQEAISYMEKTYNVDKVGSLGWCFGGGQSLTIAEQGATDATVIYYGFVHDDTARLQRINGPVLGLFAENDQGIPPATVNDFASALDDAGIPNNIIIYSNVGHAFANPTGSAYAPETTQEAWLQTISFLDKNLKNKN